MAAGKHAKRTPTTAFVTGNASVDADRIGRGGWILGSFFDARADSDRNVEELEVKWWSFQPGEEGSHSTKTSETVEWTMLLSGRVTATLDGEETELAAGDYVLIRPGTVNNVVSQVLEPTTGITVKAPSDPTAKQVLPA